MSTLQDHVRGERPEELRFDRHRLRAVRELVRRKAERAGFDPGRVADLVLAAHELAANSVRHAGGDSTANSVRHAGGDGTVRVWRETGELLCEVEDRGGIDRPLAPREPPIFDGEHGRGLWIASRLCDLVQIRSSPTGSIVRLHMSLE